jgi:simple sugar transport system substrate-binding protein
MRVGRILGVAVGTLLLAGAAAAQEKHGQGMTSYIQMGGNPRGRATLPRTNGAKAAAEAFGVDLIEQFSGWRTEDLLHVVGVALGAVPD